MAPDPLWQSLVTLFTVVTAAVSAKAAMDTVKETRASGTESAERNAIAEAQRRVLIRPHVVVYLRPGRTHSDFLETSVYIHNVGPGAARQVELEVIKGGDFVLRSEKRLDEWGPITEGVNVLPPDDYLSTGFMTSPADDLVIPEVLIEVRYKDIEGRSYEAERFSLGLAFLRYTTGPARIVRSDDPEQRIARSLEEIAKRRS